MKLAVDTRQGQRSRPKTSIAYYPNMDVHRSCVHNPLVWTLVEESCVQAYCLAAGHVLDTSTKSPSSKYLHAVLGMKALGVCLISHSAFLTF